MRLANLMLGAVVITAACGFAQSLAGPSIPNIEGASDTPQNEIIRKDVDEVSLVFSARDYRQRFVTDLKLGQLKLRDDRRLPERIIKFAAETDLPLRAVLLIDTSDSIHDRFEFEKARRQNSCARRCAAAPMKRSSWGSTSCRRSLKSGRMTPG
jgi:hypothetical protein